MTRHPLIFPVLAGALLALVAVRAGAWPQIASQNVGIGAQSAFPDHGNATCSDGLGGSFIAWTDVRGPDHIYVQHLDATGAVVPGWPASGIDVSTSDVSTWAYCTVMGIHPSGTGSAIVTWIDWDIPWWSHSPYWAQGVADPAAGGPTLWAAGGVQFTIALEGYPWWYDHLQGQTCASGDGGVLLAFTTDGGLTYVQKLSGAGVPAWPELGSVVHTTDFMNDLGWATDWYAPDWNMRPAPDGHGGAFVVWEDLRNWSYWQTAAQHIEANGAVAAGAWGTDGLLVSWDPVNALGAHSGASRITSDGGTGAIVLWEDWSNGYMGAQRLANDGTRLWDNSGTGGSGFFHFNTGYGLGQGSSTPALCGDDAGGAIAAYIQFGGDASAFHLTPGGVQDWTFPAAPAGTGLGQTPDIVADGLGGANVAWAETRPDFTNDIVTQHYDAHGALLQGPTGALLTNDAFDQLSPKACLDGGVGAIVNWIDQRPFPAPARAGLPVSLSNPNAKRMAPSGSTRNANGGVPARARSAKGPAGAQAATSVGSMFAQQVNSIGELGGRVIGSYTTGVAPPARPTALAVHGGAPNPAVDRMRIAFSLPADGAASLEVMDIAGRRVWSRDVGALGAGRHMVDLGSVRGASAGLYFVRLRQGVSVATGKVLLER